MRHSRQPPSRILPAEKGTIRKDWGGRIPVCIVFPNTYYIGMSNLAVHILYTTLNNMPDVVCERCFLREEGESLSLESGKPPGAFEIVLFTLSFELDYANIASILGSSVGPLAAARDEGDPLIAAGGTCVLSNPEPIAGLFDLFLLGDIEATIPAFMEKYREIRGMNRAERIHGLSSFGWVYNPANLEVTYNDNGTVDAFKPPDYSVAIKPYGGARLGSSAIITEGSEFSNMLLVEGTRGCCSACPFCLIGNVNRFHHDELTKISPDVMDVGIIGGGVSFHPHLVSIVRRLKDEGRRVHLPSLRIDEVPLEVIELIKDGIKTLTFGIEAGTERLRKFIGKPLSEGEILEKTEVIYGMKSFNLKLYFMVGIYGEDISDTEAIIDLVKGIRHVMVKKGAERGALGSITVHASPFVPKPSTPFQWLPMEDPRVLMDRIHRLKRALGKMDNVYFTHESVKYSYIQALLSRGDRRTGAVVSRLSSGENFQKILKESPINLNFYVLRERPEEEVLPWDFIKGRTSKGSLLRRLDSARKSM